MMFCARTGNTITARLKLNCGASSSVLDFVARAPDVGAVLNQSNPAQSLRIA
jgi:hypothetical protein